MNAYVMRSGAADSHAAPTAPPTRWPMLRQFLRVYLVVVFPVIVIVLLAGWISDEINSRNFVEQVRGGTAMRYAWVRNQLGGTPVDRWKTEIDAARRLYPTGLGLEEASSFFKSIHPDEAEMQRFDRGEVALAPAPLRDAGDEHERRGMTYSFQRVPGTTFVLSSQLSFTNSNAALTYLYYLAFAVFAAAPILWFWFRPFWRDLERLGGVTEQIGAGDFSVHAAPVRSSTVKPFAAAIDQMSARIGELMEAQTQLTNSVAHELTTPITQLVFALELLKGPVTPAKAASLLDGMAADLKELDSLVAELLEYARLRHAAVYEPESIDLRELLEGALESARHSPFGDKAIVLDLARDERLEQVRCDAHQMHRAVVNLLRNALRYSRTRIALSAEHRVGRTLIHVDDDGPGIPSDERSRLYEPFARSDASRTRETGGHGLGLAIVQQVAKLHGGTSRIDVSPLGGTRVTIAW